MSNQNVNNIKILGGRRKYILKTYANVHESVFQNSEVLEFGIRKSIELLIYDLSCYY